MIPILAIVIVIVVIAIVIGLVIVRVILNPKTRIPIRTRTWDPTEALGASVPVAADLCCEGTEATQTAQRASGLTKSKGKVKA